MIISFDAESLVEELVADNDPPYLQVGMTDAGSSHYLLLNRAKQFDESEDWGIYVEIDDQLYSGYDCIAVCELSPDKMIVRLSKPLGRTRQIEAVEVKFRPDQRPSREFVARVQAIFTGRDGLLRVIDDAPQ